jgi:hypothetical protein
MRTLYTINVNDSSAFYPYVSKKVKACFLKQVAKK